MVSWGGREGEGEERERETGGRGRERGGWREGRQREKERKKERERERGREREERKRERQRGRGREKKRREREGGNYTQYWRKGGSLSTLSKIIDTRTYMLSGIQKVMHHNVHVCMYRSESGMESLRHPYLLEAVNNGRLVIEPSVLLLYEEVTESHSLVLKLTTLDLGCSGILTGQDLGLKERSICVHIHVHVYCREGENDRGGGRKREKKKEREREREGGGGTCVHIMQVFIAKKHSNT